MASDMIAAQHNCEGLLKFILPNDMVTVDFEVMILTGIHKCRKDRNCSEKSFSLGARGIHLLQYS